MARGATAQKARSLTHLQSLNVIRNMIRVSVSEICYLRNLFPEELFKERVYADMHVKCLAPTEDMGTKDADDALLITKWLEDGVFEALGKKYLESVSLCVYSLSASCKPGRLLESYTYNVKHAANGSTELFTSFTGKKALICTPENVKLQTIQLIRSLVSITNNLDPLPRNRLVTMKIIFNETCPPNWQPQHFQMMSDEYPDHDKSTSLKLAVGQVSTPHHLVTVEIETAEESIESLSQASSKSSASQSAEQHDDESDVTSYEDETPPHDFENENNNANLVEDSDHEESIAHEVATSLEIARIDFVSFIVLGDLVDKLSIEKRFPSCPPTQLAAWIKEAEVGGLLRENKTRNQFEVAVHDTDLFNRAINATHGKLKRQISIATLSKEVSITTCLGEAMLLRMEQEKLVRRSTGDTFEILFSECNRDLVRKAIREAKEKHHEKESRAKPGLEKDVYDFEPDIPVTAAKSKRKTQTTRGSTRASTCRKESLSTTGSRAATSGVPIVQVRRALKKRKLAIQRIS